MVDDDLKDLNLKCQTKTKQEILLNCQVSEKELKDFINQPDSANIEKFLSIYEIEPEKFCLMERGLLLQLISDLLMLLNTSDVDYESLHKSGEGISSEVIMQNNNGLLKNKHTVTDIEFAMKFIADKSADS